MQGKHDFLPETRTAIDLESFISDDHFLRKVDRVLELSFVRELTASCYVAGQGWPSIDPEVYFRMVSVGYLYGIAKDRRLCEEIHYNLAYRWFCRLSLEDDVPDHSSLSHMRDPTFRQKMSQRMWKCEGLFAEAKQNHGLTRARYRGRRKVQIQAYLSATAQNLKRLVLLFYCWLILVVTRSQNPNSTTNQIFPGQTFSTGPFLFQFVPVRFRTLRVIRTTPTPPVR